MKSIKILLGAMCAIAAMSLAAYADAPLLMTVYNGHGQSVQLFTPGERDIAVYAGGAAVVETTTPDNSQAGQCQFSLQITENGHGQQRFLYRQCGM